MKKNGYRMYNVIFPLFMLYVLPSHFMLFILVGNFVIDSLVILGVGYFKKFDYKSIWKQSILKVWLFGFLADILGGLVCILLMFTGMVDCLTSIGLDYPWVFLPLAIPGVIVSAIAIYFFNKKICYNKCSMEIIHIKSLTIWMTIITTPYLMLIPPFMSF